VRSKSIGAIYGGNVTEGSKCELSPQHTAHTQGTRSIQRGNGTLHAWVRFGAKLTWPCHDTPPTVSIPLGQWMKVQGEFKMQAHITSSVVVDIAAFEVSHSAGIDSDATTLRAARARSSSIHRGNGGNVTEGSKCELPPVNTAHTQGTQVLMPCPMPRSRTRLS
jgi:hypothetical protein